MSKNATIIIVVIIIALAGVGAAVALRPKKTEAPKTTDTSQSTTPEHTEGDGHNHEEETTPTEESTKAVEISNFAFAPESITVKKGTTVTWTNKDSVAHTVTPDETSNDLEGSPSLAKDESYTFTFNTAGTFTYHCQPHPQMKGTVVVTE